jgi:phospholipid/cholesterol/gamma-HCH transport system substrate-binding protein
MSTERKGVEVYVGLFLLIGFSVVAAMVVTFGKVGQGLTKFYSITVVFPNASGLVKGADVLLAGARVGHVNTAPTLVVKPDGYSVKVELKIRADIKLPSESTIVVNQSGLLGDCFVDVIPPANPDPSKLIAEDALVEGYQRPGLDALQQQGDVVLKKLASELDEIKILTVSMNEKLLSDHNLKNLSETFEHLKLTSNNLSDSTRKLDPIFTKADEAVDSAKKTLGTVDKAAADLRLAMADFKKVAEAAGKTLDSAKATIETGNRVLQKADRGEGALGMFLSDRETAENLRALIGNMRRSGPVFYKDRPPDRPAATPPPKRR